jgi:polyvinyl alcohol dehydrogenase (cytochrome)
MVRFGRMRARALAGMAALAVTVLGAALLRPAPVAADPTTVDASILDQAGDRLFPEGKHIYQANCAACHDQGVGRAPQFTILRYMSPEAIHRALTTGVMRQQAAALTEDQKVQVAQFLSSRKLAPVTAPVPLAMCSGKAATFDRSEPPVFAGWGLDLAGTHTIPSAVGGLSPANVGKLKLKWSFGFAGSERMRSQPSLAGGAIFLGSHTGDVFALDRATGCVRWHFQAAAEVRTAVVIAPWQVGDAGAAPLAYFGDVRGVLYALDAFTGALKWKVTADEHPAAVITAAPSLYQGTLFVPVSSLEEASATAPGYKCCTFRGSVLALDAATGAVKWRSWMVPEPKPLAGSSNGDEHFGPSGAAVWNSPAIDALRGQLTIDTGDNYTHPVTDYGDAILALDLATGAVRWHYQATKGDAWNVACMVAGNTNCPEDAGPDFDFGAGTILARDRAGKDIVLAGQKSSFVYALDPASGKLLWQTRLGRGGAAGGVNFGMAAMDGAVFAPVSDMFTGVPSEVPGRPGVHALDIATGKELWYTRVGPDCDAAPRTCVAGTSGSLSATNGMVMVGADDGRVLILDAKDGRTLWSFDTAQPLQTVNGVPAHGGSISGGVAPIAYKGELIVASGYAFGAKKAGNALLVFGTE